MEEPQRTIYHTELAVREPTGLVLGVFDEITIQRKIYQREFGPGCQFRRADDEEGAWARLPEHKPFADAFWVAGITVEEHADKRVARFAWGHAARSASPGAGARSVVSSAGPAPAPPEEDGDGTAVFEQD